MTAHAVMTLVNSPEASGNLYETGRYTVVHGFYVFKLFLMVGKEEVSLIQWCPLRGVPLYTPQ